MGGDKIPPNGSRPFLNLQNVQIDTEFNWPAAAVENALSEIRIHRRNLDKADHGFATFRNPATFFQDLHRKINGRSVLCEGFSIREYVAKVRSVDIRKCWPLSESLLEDSLRVGQKPPLPPLVRPNYRWWSCHLCLEMFGEHKHFGASFDRFNSLSIKEPENNSKNLDHIKEQQLTVSFDTETGPGFPQDLDEQIRKLRRVKLSGQDFNISRSEDGIKNIELENQTRAKKSAFDVIGREGGFPNVVENGKEKAKAMRGSGKAVDQAGTQSASLECKGRKINNLDSEITKIDSRRHANFDIGNSEGSGVKICPVCTTFTSATITAVNAHIDNCLAQVSMREKRQVIRMQKQKSRTQKKRSIVDICAASPPIEINVEHLHGMNANSKLAIKVTANGALREDINSIESGKSTNGVRQPESLETKRRRQRLGTITCVLGSKDLKVGLVSYVIISILCYLY